MSNIITAKVAEKKLFTWKKSFIHAIEWRIIAVILDFLVILIITGKPSLSLALSSISAAVRTVGHAIWIKIKLRNVEGDFYGL